MDSIYPDNWPLFYAWTLSLLRAHYRGGPDEFGGLALDIAGSFEDIGDMARAEWVRGLVAGEEVERP